MKISPQIKVMTLDAISKPFKMLANSKAMSAICDKFELNKEKALNITTIASIVGKDSIGCYMYVKQSLNNEKIPEEKRSFVAALDLTNGGLMILSQLLMFFTISNKKVQGKIFGKLFNKVFSENAKNAYINCVRSKEKMANKTKEEIATEFYKLRDRSANIFGFLTALVASTTIAKRIIVPFIATPMASWAQTKILKKGKPENNTDKTSEPKQPENSQPKQAEQKNQSVTMHEKAFNGVKDTNLLNQYLK